MVAFDASFLILTFDADAVSKEGSPRLQERLDIFFTELQKTRTKIIIPTPALSEFLVKCDPRILQSIHKQSAFRIAPFDERAAIEAAIMTKDAIRESDKKDPVQTVTWSKIKFDRQIVAVSKVEGVDAIYSTDPHIVKHAQRAGIACFGIPDLPVAPTVQESFPEEVLGGRKQEEEQGGKVELASTDIRGSGNGHSEGQARAEAAEEKADSEETG
jgi:hypothetical protein